MRAFKRQDVCDRIMARVVTVQALQLVVTGKPDGDARVAGRQSRPYLRHVRRPLHPSPQERRWNRDGNRLDHLDLESRSLSHRRQVNPLQSCPCESWSPAEPGSSAPTWSMHMSPPATRLPSSTTSAPGARTT